MKKRMICAAVLFGSLLLFTACRSNAEETADGGTETASESEAAESGGLEGEESGGQVHVTIETFEEEIRNEEGKIIMTVSGGLPVVEIPEIGKAADKINDFYKKRREDYDALVQEYTGYATEYFAKLAGQGTPNVYIMSRNYKVKRADQEVISFLEEDFEYTGGAHENMVRRAQNFDGRDGRLLSFADAVTDEAAARKAIENFIIQQIERMPEEYFPDYADNVDRILTNETWYLDETGIHIIVNEYIVAPHVAGIQDFLIEYGEFPYLKEEYLPVLPE